MRNHRTYFSRAFALVVLLYFTSLNAMAQESMVLTAGAGMPELLYLGARFQFDQTHVGFTYGSAPLGPDDQIRTISGEVYFHIKGTSEFTAVKPVYLRVAINSLREETEFVIEEYIYLTTRIGRDLNISQRMGFQADIGLGVLLMQDEERKVPSRGFNLEIQIPVIPSLSVGWFYRI